jgi:DNA-binding beta-propeller fold protein YncE/mono/diheme cytochrome c family protein
MMYAAFSRVALFAGLVLAFASATAGRADKPAAKPAPVSYYKDVRRIVQQHCQGCHQPAKDQGGYVMTTHAGLLKTGDSGKAPVVPGQPDKSELIAQVVPGADKKVAMPKNRDPLPAADVATLKRWIAEGAKDDTPKTARDTISEKNPPVYKLPPVLTSIDFSPDGKYLAVAGFHEVLLHKADGSGLVARLIGLSERIQSVAFSPDGKSLAAVGGSPGRFGEVQVWDVAKKKLNFSLSLTFDTLYGASWSPDGSKIAFGGGDNSMRVIDATNGKQVTYLGAHSDWVLGTAFSQDGKHVASVSRDMSAKLTVVATQRFVDNITSITPGQLKGGLQAVDRRPLAPKAKPATVKGVDGQDKLYDELLFGGSDGVPRLYKMHRVKQRTIGDDDNRVRGYEAMPGRVFALRFNKDGTQFVAGSSGGDGKGEVRVYATAKAKPISKLDKVGPIYCVAFHPEGKTVASAGFDGAVRLSDAATGKVIKEFVPVPLSKDKK